MADRWILVGIDGGEAGEAAVEYAARYAADRDWGLRLLHVAPEATYAVSVAPEPVGYATARPRDALDTAVLRARELMAGGPDQVVADLDFGGRVDRLLGASADCDLVVLGDQRRPRIDRLATGSVLAGVAARCVVPVVGVPAGWTPNGTDPLVIAAVKDAEDSDGLLQHAARAAVEQGGRLRVLHAREPWHGVPGHRSGWEETVRAELARLIEAQAGDRAELGIDVAVVAGQPARVIVDASEDADLLVLTRRPLQSPHGHLGRTGRAVLRESRCPVVVLPPVADGAPAQTSRTPPSTTT